MYMCKSFTACGFTKNIIIFDNIEEADEWCIKHAIITNGERYYCAIYNLKYAVSWNSMDNPGSYFKKY